MGRGEKGIGEMSVQSMEEMWKDFCPIFLQPRPDPSGKKDCEVVALSRIDRWSPFLLPVPYGSERSV